MYEMIGLYFLKNDIIAVFSFFVLKVILFVSFLCCHTKKHVILDCCYCYELLLSFFFFYAYCPSLPELYAQCTQLRFTETVFFFHCKK